MKFTIFELVMHIMYHIFELFKGVKCVKEHIETNEWDEDKHKENIQQKGGN